MRNTRLWILNLILWIVLYPFAAFSQSAISHITLIQGRVEWVLPQSVDSKSPIVQNALEISLSSLEELERNLIYKTSDRIHLMAFNDYSKYRDFYENKNSLQTFNSDPLDKTIHGMVYHPILLTGNTIDIVYQIRRAVATQFIYEYLNGFSYRERFHIPESQNTPEWLKEGFIAYFSSGIDREEFIEFIAALNNSSFRNLNFIDPRHHVLFGKVLWYLFEKEKGKNLNSVFWMLIKYAQSFENSFEYHFNQNFRDWLAIKIAELQQSQTIHSFNSDYSIEAPLSQNSHLKLAHSPQSQSAIITQSADNHESCYKWDLQNKSITPLLQNTTLHALPFPSFQENTWTYNNSIRTWIHVLWEGNWQMRFNNKTINLPDALSYRLVSSKNDTVYLLQELTGKTYLLLLDLQNGSELNRINLNSNGAKIQELQIVSQEESVFIQIYPRNGLYTTELVRLKLKPTLEMSPLYEVSHENTQPAFQHVVYENDHLFSVVQNSALENAVYHIQKNGEEIQTKKTPTKGFQYQQYPSGEGDSLIEFFIGNKQWNINFIEITAPIFDRDTFIQPILSFDTAHYSKDTQIHRKTYDSSTLFTSPFTKRPLKFTTLLKTPHLKAKWQNAHFSPWFYIHESHFFISNKDFHVPYDGRVSPVQQYNSPLGFFFENILMDISQKNRIEFNVFSNINRRRIGLELNHKYIFSQKTTLKSNIHYRLRQFMESDFTQYRNRNWGGQIQIERHLRSQDVYAGITLFNSQIIALNNSIEKIGLPSVNRSLFEVPIGIKYYNKRLSTIPYHVNYLADIGLNSGLIIDQKNWNILSRIQGSVHFKSRLGIFEWKSRTAAAYSFSEFNATYQLGGSSGWISQTANTDVLYSKLRPNQKQFIFESMPIRGVQSGIRMGNSYLHVQQDLGLPLLRLFPKSLKERVFWKSMILYGFGDAGIAFFGPWPSHFSNPYNTVSIRTPNYTISVSSNQNPWIFGYGFGAQVNILGYPIRVEYAQGQLGSLKTAPRLLLSLGKNF